MERKGESKLVFLILVLVVVVVLAVWLAMSKREVTKSEEISPIHPKVAGMGEKIEMPMEKLDEAWESANKLAKGGPSVEVDYPKEFGTKDARVRIDAFFPVGAGEGLTISTNTLKKLAEEYKGKLYVRISLLVGPVAREVGLDCAGIFINGKNHITVGGEEIILLRKNTHNPELLEKAVKEAVAQAYPQ